MVEIGNDAFQARQRLAQSEGKKLEGKVTRRVALLVSRLYMWGAYTKPIEEMTDKDFCHPKGFRPSGCGGKTLSEIRAVIPSPEVSNKRGGKC